MPDNHFDTDVAERYDDGLETPDAKANLVRCVDTLHDLANGGPVLEFAIGPGRVALPLAATGLELAGIELSPAMLTVLSRKPGAEALTLIEGNMAETRLGQQ